MTITDNGTAAARDAAYRRLETNARALLADGASTDDVARETGLSFATVDALAEENALDTAPAA